MPWSVRGDAQACVYFFNRRVSQKRYHRVDKYLQLLDGGVAMVEAVALKVEDDVLHAGFSIGVDLVGHLGRGASECTLVYFHVIPVPHQRPEPLVRFSGGHLAFGRAWYGFDLASPPDWQRILNWLRTQGDVLQLIELSVVGHVVFGP